MTAIRNPPRRTLWKPPSIGSVDRVVNTLRSEVALRWLLYLCVLENGGLAVVNSLLITVNNGIVVFCQLILTIFALILVFLRRPVVSQSFFVVFLSIVVLSMIVSVTNGGLQPRFFYDIALIPIFVLLGSTAKKPDISIFFNLLIIVFVIALLELCLSSVYLDIFNPKKYFNATRDWVVMGMRASGKDATTYGVADYYGGVMRVSGTIFGAPHRLGSIFLEPLGLAYFSVISCMFFLQSNELRGWKRMFVISSCLFLAGLSDTRTAVFFILVMIFFKGPIKYLRREVVFFLPLLIIGSAAIFYTLDYGATGDTEYRLSLTFDALSRSSVLSLLFGGMDNALVMASFGDSGFIYFVNNVGFFGYILFIWVASGVFSGRRVPVFIVVSTITYIVVQSLFGAAFLSIKTACLLGYGIGAIGNSAGAVDQPMVSQVKAQIKTRFPRPALQTAAPRYPD